MSPATEPKCINEKWKPPHLLHIDRFSRQNYAATLFDSTFAFRFEPYRRTYERPVARWLKAQEIVNLRHVTGIRLIRRRRRVGEALGPLRTFTADVRGRWSRVWKHPRPNTVWYENLNWWKKTYRLQRRWPYFRLDGGAMASRRRAGGIGVCSMTLVEIHRHVIGTGGLASGSDCCISNSSFP